MKNHINLMDKELGKLAEAVLKERFVLSSPSASALITDAPTTTHSELSTTHLTTLTAALNPIASHAGPASHAPAAPNPTSDPVLVRALVESQLKVQIGKENEMLTSVLLWTEKTEVKERAVWAEMNRCWAVWEQAK